MLKRKHFMSDINDIAYNVNFKVKFRSGGKNGR